MPTVENVPMKLKLVVPTPVLPQKLPTLYTDTVYALCHPWALASNDQARRYTFRSLGKRTRRALIDQLGRPPHRLAGISMLTR